MPYREKTKYTGVYQKVSKKRLHKGKPDVCFECCYRADGRLIWEKAGWESEGYSANLASQVRSERIRNFRHGEELPQKKKYLYFKDVMTKYLEWAKANKKSWVNDESRYNNYLAARFDDKRLNEIAPLDLERMKSELTKDNLSSQTIKHALCVIRQAINKAIEWGMYKGDNPVKKVKMPFVDNQRLRFLTYEEADRLLSALKKISKQVHDMALLSLLSGLRVGEIFNLKMQDINFENALISVKDSKNQKSRQAPMPGGIKNMLKDYYEKDVPDAYAFIDKRNGEKVKYLSATYYRVVKNLGFNTGINDRREKVTFHTLRHTCGSWLAMQGESIFTIRDVLGHKTTAMTNRYSHLTADHRQAAISRLEEGFNEKITAAAKKAEETATQ